MTVKLKDIAYALGIAFFIASIVGALFINNSIIILIGAFPLILFNRKYVVPLLLIIPAIEGAFKVENTASITESVAIAGLMPLFIYDLLQKNKQHVPLKLTALYVVFAFFIILGLFVYQQHPEVYTNVTRKTLDSVYMRIGTKVVKVLFFFIYLKVLINYDKDFLIKALKLFRDIVPYLLFVIAGYLITVGRVTEKYGTLHFGEAHHGDFTSNVCAMGVYMYIAIFDKNTSLLKKGIMMAALAAMLYVVMQMASRNGLLCFAFVSMISAYLVLKNRSTDMKVIIVMAGIVVATTALYIFQDSPTIQRALFQTEENGSGDRVSYWSSGIEAIGEAPVLGLGGDESSSIYAVSKYAPDVPDHVMHNTFLEMAVEYGLLGMGFYIILVYTILRWGYKNFNYALKNDNLLLAAPGISYFISIFAGLFISRVWESTLWYHMTLVFTVGLLWVYPSTSFAKFKKRFTIPSLQNQFG